MTDVSAADEAVEETGAETSAPRKRRFSGKKIFIFLILPAVLVVGVVMFGLPMLSEKSRRNMPLKRRNPTRNQAKRSIATCRICW